MSSASFCDRCAEDPRIGQRTAQAAKEIKRLSHNSSTEVKTGVKLVRNAGAALKTINGFNVEINTHMEPIATSAKKQCVGLGEVNITFNSMDQTKQQNAVVVDQQNAASGTLANEAVKLQKLVCRFRVGVSANSGTPRAMRADDTAHYSSARTLNRRLTSTFDGNGALVTKVHWKDPDENDVPIRLIGTPTKWRQG